MNTWWWQGPKIRNFGDELGKHILKKMGYSPKRVGLKNADILTVGTILDQASERAKDGCVIWGSGASWETTIDNRFDVKALRGKLSQKVLNVYDVPIGDPGLLVSYFWDKKSFRYDVGVVRHYVDDEEYGWADIVIDANEPVDQVIEKISSCKTICSSSLHGIVVANSFNIPAMKIYNPQVIGENFKWLDYQSALSKPIIQIQDELLKVF